MLLDVGVIEGRAALIRTKLGLLDAGPKFETTPITERFFPNVSITGDFLPKGITEMVVRDGGRYQLYYSRRVGHPSQRLGIIHGCYHILSDLAERDGIRECNLTDRKFRTFTGAESSEEVACDLFAGALLVPFTALDRLAPDVLFPRDPVERHVFDDQVDRLASKFGVPAGFINWRLYDLAQLRRSHFKIR